MKKYLFFVLLLLFSFSSTAKAGIDTELRNAEAFSGKNSYFASTGYFNNAIYSTHRTAYSNAISKLDAVANANISFHSTSTGTSTDPIEIKMTSVNSTSYDWYGLANKSTTYATLSINEYICAEAGFTQINYNKTALHELGHAFYMVHQASAVDSVMKSGKYSYNDYSTLDKYNFAYKY